MKNQKSTPWFKRKVVFTSGLVCLLMLGLVWISPAAADKRKVMTINAVRVLAERAIIESVIGLKTCTTERVEEMVAVRQKIDAKTAANIKGIEYSDIVYDSAKDIAKVTARINLGNVRTIVGKNINWGNRTIERVSFATSTPANAGPLKTLRAAELDAYSQLAKRIIGLDLESETSVENFILQSDDARTRLLAAIYGANMVGYRWDSNGDAYVKLSLKMEEVQDILGQRIRYDGVVVEVEGSCARKDDFSQAQNNDKTGTFINI